MMMKTNLPNYLKLSNEDNMQLMSRYEDNYFDLAIVDPPYGIGESGKTNKTRGKLTKSKDYGDKEWDKTSPPKKYFDELIRVSKNQIIWGANHFISKIALDSPSWIFWNKLNGDNDFADGELAYTSFKTAVRKLNFRWAGMLQQDMKNKEVRIHPTQKPVGLYEWLLKNYAQPNQKILDTHLGSASIAIAIHRMNERDNMNLELTGCELDKDYFDDSIKRIQKEVSQKTIFSL